MPSSLSADLIDFLKSTNPEDVAGLFAGFRNFVPIAFALHSGETNANNDEELAKRRGYSKMIPMPAPNERADDALAYQEFVIQNPDPKWRKFLLDAQRARYKEMDDPYSPTTATRRKDYEVAPVTARHALTAALNKKYANGGPVDFSTPDMVDGVQYIPDAQLYGKGGLAKKTLDQIAAEMLQKGVILENPSRRSFFGLNLDPAKSYPLVKSESDVFKEVPVLPEKTVSVKKAAASSKSNPAQSPLKSLSEAPLSRRDVLQMTAGQVLRGALPQGALPGLGDVAKVVELVVEPTAAPAMSLSLQGLIARAAKHGLSIDDTTDMLVKLGHKEDDAFWMQSMMNDPFEFSGDYMTDYAMPRMEAIGNLISSSSKKPMSMRNELRDIKRENPDMYQKLREAANDIFTYGHEN